MLLAPQPQRLSQKSNPYVGTFHHGHEASKRLGGGGEKSPPHGPLIVGGVQQRSPMLTSQGGSPAVRGMCEAMTSQTHRERMKQALQLNASVPSDPEMCGLQALLPRQSGIDLLCAFLCECVPPLSPVFPRKVTYASTHAQQGSRCSTLLARDRLESVSRC